MISKFRSFIRCRILNRVMIARFLCRKLADKFDVNGGVFVIDVVNGNFVRKNFNPRNWVELEDCYQLENSEITSDGIFSAWTRIPKKGGKALTRAFFNRMYSKPRLCGALVEAGLTPLKFWGGFSGRPLTGKRNRLIVLARKSG